MTSNKLESIPCNIFGNLSQNMAKRFDGLDKATYALFIENLSAESSTLSNPTTKQQSYSRPLILSTLVVTST